MATVATILDLLKDKLLPYELAFAVRGSDDVALIRAINAGKSKVWKTAVGASHGTDGAWFAKQGSVSFSSANSGALPTDFHALLSAESTSVVMRPSAFHKQAWRDGRAVSGSVDPSTLDELLYLVGGHTDGTQRLKLSRTVSSLTVTIDYTAKLPVWSASSDNIDLMPEVFYEAIADCAAASLLGAAQDAAIASLWRGAWKDSQEMVAAVCAGRQFGGKISDEDYH